MNICITTISNYLEFLYQDNSFEKELKLSKKEIEIMSQYDTDMTIREEGLVKKIKPTKGYCVLTIGKLHVPAAVNKLQKLGYKTLIFVPSRHGSLADVVAYEKIKDELLEGFEKTKNSDKESLVIADNHCMIYSLEGILKSPEELIGKNVKEISICMEHARPPNELNFLFKKEKHCFHIYDELKDYAEKCKKAGISLELIGLECREDGKEIC